VRATLAVTLLPVTQDPRVEAKQAVLAPQVRVRQRQGSALSATAQQKAPCYHLKASPGCHQKEWVLSHYGSLTHCFAFEQTVALLALSTDQASTVALHWRCA
jgi:hypothetical protein